MGGGPPRPPLPLSGTLHGWRWCPLGPSVSVLTCLAPPGRPSAHLIWARRSRAVDSAPGVAANSAPSARTRTRSPAGQRDVRDWNLASGRRDAALAYELRARVPAEDGERDRQFRVPMCCRGGQLRLRVPPRPLSRANRRSGPLGIFGKDRSGSALCGVPDWLGDARETLDGRGVWDRDLFSNRG